MTDTGTFRTTIHLENPLRRGELHALPETVVNPAAMLTWAPGSVLEALGVARQKTRGFSIADGETLYRDIGYAIVHAGARWTSDEVVFAEPDDRIVLGARSLSGLNLRIDWQNMQLVDAGPIVAASAA